MRNTPQKQQNFTSRIINPNPDGMTELDDSEDLKSNNKKWWREIDSHNSETTFGNSASQHPTQNTQTDFELYKIGDLPIRDNSGEEEDESSFAEFSKKNF